MNELFTQTAANTPLKPGDPVRVKADLFHNLTFVIHYLTEEAGQPMACGPYGCFAIDLLEKTG
ncbi:hypothetical protein ACS5NO_13735 [Larkinella sp. GY13]|uniref:hypothetical protein n=1 Tax=Larkinella sp. GY13 TaxID=3453720 RepID=UPI003EEA9D40